MGGFFEKKVLQRQFDDRFLSRKVASFDLFLPKLQCWKSKHFSPASCPIQSHRVEFANRWLPECLPGRLIEPNRPAEVQMHLDPLSILDRLAGRQSGDQAVRTQGQGRQQFGAVELEPAHLGDHLWPGRATTR